MKKVDLLKTVILTLGALSFAQLKDGIYRFDSERVLKSIDVETMYQQYGVHAVQDIVRNTEGDAVRVKESSFTDPENGLVLSVDSNGKITSLENSTIRGKISGESISYNGYYEENSQTVHIICSGILVKYSDKERAAGAFNGIYHATDTGTGRKQVITVKNGLYTWKYEDGSEDDFEGWPIIVNSDGTFSYKMEYTVRSIFENISSSVITSKTISSGKINPNGNLSLKVITMNNGSGSLVSSEPQVYSAVKSSGEINESGDPEVIITKGRKKTAASGFTEKAAPSWFTEDVTVSGNEITSCAFKKGVLGVETTQQIAEAEALAKVNSYLGLKINQSTDAQSSSSSGKTQKHLYEVLDELSVRKLDYKVVNLFKDEKNGIIWVMIKAVVPE